VASGRPVLTLIQDRLANTLTLMTTALVVSLVIALGIGIVSALKQYSLVDYLATGFSLFGISMPSFWFGLMMILVFSLWLGILPTSGMYSVGQQNNFLNRAQHLIMPVTVLSLLQVAQWSRFIRSSLLEVLRQDYVRTARAKGVAERAVMLRHALRNALIPLITVVALAIPSLFGGAIITETIFAWPGMGRLYYDAVLATDWPVAMGLLIITAALVVMSNLVADILYAVVDPRIRYD
jgi:peptide/nickel transport system permease protein